MNKRGVFLFLFLLGACPASLFAQKENNIWYFGNKIGLDFHSIPPKPLQNSEMLAPEGCASVCDSAGNLLFYTGAGKVWNKKHQVMENGSGLLVNGSSTQSSVAVKKPGSYTEYYVFSADSYENPGDGVNYSVVDLSYNGGLGKVTEKNKKLYNGISSEKVTCVKNAKNDGYWIITHPVGSSAFYVYGFTVSGINTVPVISHTGTSYTYNPILGINGYLKASPNGKKLVACLGGINNSGIELFDFDNSTGIVSNGVILEEGYSFYGCSFSPNSKLLYATGHPKLLLQFDV
ncbi:MAG TPA: hypothetical protein VEC12_10015, partial [Bacteroidia bacterium]|nr:hypothetical protein [Bacteroidia bacterium]